MEGRDRSSQKAPHGRVGPQEEHIARETEHPMHITLTQRGRDRISDQLQTVVPCTRKCNCRAAAGQCLSFLGFDVCGVKEKAGSVHSGSDMCEPVSIASDARS